MVIVEVRENYRGVVVVLMGSHLNHQYHPYRGSAGGCEGLDGDPGWI